MPNNWLVIYYDGNQDVAAIIRNVRPDDLGDHVTLTAERFPDWDVTMVLELHHDYIDGDLHGIPPAFALRGIPLNIEALPEFGDE